MSAANAANHAPRATYRRGDSARNEEQHIVDVLTGLPSMVDMAVVVNDGSTDARVNLRQR